MKRQMLASGLLAAVVGLVGTWAAAELTADAGPRETAPATTAATREADLLRLETLDLTHMTQDWGEPGKAKSVEGNPLRIGGVTYAHGLGTHAESRLVVDLKKAATKFVAAVGVDDEAKGGTVEFSVALDGKVVWKSGVMKSGEQAKEIVVDVTGAKEMVLQVTDGGDGINWDHADWAEAGIVVMAGAKARPEAAAPVDEPVEIAHGDPKEPMIHGPKVVGTTPGRPFLFLIPATGEGALQFAAEGLPAGLTVDAKTGIITGSVKQAGTYEGTVAVTNALGTAKRKLKIVAGEHQLALTPPMGWNSWNVWAQAVDDGKVRAAADAMVKSGLAAKGFSYVNIDDCWEGQRNEQGEIQTNKKFPDMKKLADYVHDKGLKVGIYSSPGPKTCAGFLASYEHEEQDAKTWAGWGIDYIKYDWCSYDKIANQRIDQLMMEAREHDRIREAQEAMRDKNWAEKKHVEIQRFVAIEAYAKLRSALDKCDRDIVYSLCQYGYENVWEWGAGLEVRGNLWRTTGDITDTWASMSGIGFGQTEKEKWAGPGHWNDPDMLVVGKVGWGPRIHPTHLTKNEQITHISLWSLLAAPLLIGCDMNDMDTFTLDLLTNSEVLAVDQDELGKQAKRVSQEKRTEVWARPLADGTVAVGLFNRGDEPAAVTASWEAIGAQGKQAVRDLWRKKDLGEMEGKFEAKVPRHGCVLVKVGRGKE